MEGNEGGISVTFQTENLSLLKIKTKQNSDYSNKEI